MSPDFPVDLKMSPDFPVDLKKNAFLLLHLLLLLLSLILEGSLAETSLTRFAVLVILKGMQIQSKIYHPFCCRVNC